MFTQNLVHLSGEPLGSIVGGKNGSCTYKHCINRICFSFCLFVCFFSFSYFLNNDLYMTVNLRADIFIRMSFCFIFRRGKDVTLPLRYGLCILVMCWRFPDDSVLL